MIVRNYKELIETVYDNYLKRNNHYLSFKEFNDNIPLRNSQIIAYLRHHCTDYDDFFSFVPFIQVFVCASSGLRA